MTAKELKAQLRNERLSARDAIPAEKRASNSLAMADHAGEAV
ncbi:5-formyltetrahydrofolate cyclo-ligase, partial [Rhizobium johnstonii]